ncbi:DNA -binding domain-containing protein, partial [Gluconobacter thailandicus]|uniref:DNA -binding domain-containing protein n=1 Tax=Gluconobacter thailandicus TaxID=257438 RepID=UPI0004967485
ATGVGERAIADRLLDEPTARAYDWPDISGRGRFRRLEHLADRLIEGGYRDLMGYPLSRRR